MSYLHLVPAVGGSFEGIGQPAPALPALFNGHFGRALKKTPIPAAPLRLLALSQTFRDIVGVLDKKYLAYDDWLAVGTANPNASLGPDGRVTGSPGVNGRLVLYVGRERAGSLFIAGGWPGAATAADSMWFGDSIADADVPEWIRAIAHESVHALARVTATTPPARPVDRVRAAVAEECRARTVEERIVNEIRATPTGRRALAGDRASAAARTCDCESSWFPAPQKRTYLEQFVLGANWDAHRRRISDADAKKILTDVAAIPVAWRKDSKQRDTLASAILRGTATMASFAKQHPVLASPAGRAAFALRLVDASWRQLIAKVGEGSKAWTDGAHRLRLVRHAKHLFQIPVTYTAC